MQACEIGGKYRDGGLVYTSALPQGLACQEMISASAFRDGRCVCPGKFLESRIR